MKRRDLLKTGAASIATTVGVAGCQGVGGEEYPSQDISWYMPFGEGSGDHVMASRFQPMFEDALGTSTQFEFRSGANTQIANETLLQQPADGYSIGTMITPHVYFTELVQDASYTLPDDFGLLGYITQDPVTVVISQDEDRFGTIQELVEYAEANKGEITVSSSAPMSVHSFAMLILEETTGAEFSFVPFDSGSEARNAVLRGEVDITFTNVFVGQSIADETETIAVFAEENNWGHLTDDAPSVFQALNWDPQEFPPNGFQGNFFLATHGDLADEYPDRLEHLRTAFEEAMNSEEYKQALAEENIEGYWNYKSPEETAEIINTGKQFYSDWAGDLQERVQGQ